MICGTERLQLEYEWEETWRALLGLATFLAGRHGEMRVSSDVGQVVLDVGLPLLPPHQLCFAHRSLDSFADCV